MEQLQIIRTTNSYLVTMLYCWLYCPHQIYSMGHRRGSLKIIEKHTEQQQMLSAATSDNKELKDSVALLKNEITEIKADITTGERRNENKPRRYQEEIQVTKTITG